MKYFKLRYWLILFFSVAFHFSVTAQDTLHVLFLGNSYTAVNNLPLMVKNMASTAGITINTVQNTPGGHTIENHLSNTNTLLQIRKGMWDYVILQEQSQIPTIDYYRYNSMYPSMLAIKDSILRYNPCAKIITYMTWGRRLGGQQCDGSGTYCSPNFRDFNHMQDSLASAYWQISDSLNIQCAPVGTAWQQVLNDTTLILHQGDNSHPNLNGSYLAACTIFSAITLQPTYGLSYNAGLPTVLTAYLQLKSDQTVFAGPVDWNLNVYQPVADFTHSISGREVQFINTSIAQIDQPLSFQWDFGDGNRSLLSNPLHRYTQVGTYQVKLIASACGNSDTIQNTLVISPISNQPAYTLFPNPASEGFNIRWNDDPPKKLIIFNSIGQQVLLQHMNVTNNYISTSSLASGLYFVKIVGSLQEAMIPVRIHR
ncbi:MAG: PKD domain-containing protein [Ferruginibacter sp.]